MKQKTEDLNRVFRVIYYLAYNFHLINKEVLLMSNYMSEAQKFEIAAYDVIRNNLKNGITFLESNQCKDIIDDVQVDNDTKTISIILVDPEDLDYTITYEDAAVNAQAIHIKATEDGYCNANIFDSDFNTPLFTVVMDRDEYFFISKVEDGLYKMQVKKTPKHFVYNIPDIMNKFPIVVTEDSIEIYEDYPAFTSKIYAYLNPFTVEKVLIDTVHTKTNIDYMHHLASVNYTISKIRNINSRILTAGSIIIERLESGDELFRVEILNDDHMVCRKLTSDIDSAVAVSYDYKYLTEPYVSIIPPYLSIISCSEENETAKFVPFTLPEEYRDDESKYDISPVIEVLNNIKTTREVDVQALDELLVKKSSGKRIDKNRNKYVKNLKNAAVKMYESMNIMDRLVEIPFLETVVIYKEDVSKTVILTRSELEGEFEKFSSWLELFDIDIKKELSK